MGPVSAGPDPAVPHLLVTGAGGFLGGAVVRAAQAAGWRVRAVVRRHDPALEVEQAVIDLAAEAARPALAAALEGVTAVVHAAAASGDDAAHARGTVAATQAVIAAMLARPGPPRLVLISSMAVYGYAALPAGVQVDETTPLEPDPALRDAYCRAKLAQEGLARRAAQAEGLAVWALRPGAIVGPGRMRTARLGIALGPVLVMPGGAAALPLITVEDCAAAVLCAARTAPAPSDYPVVAGTGCFAAVNLIGADQPSQAAHAARLARDGWPRRVVRLPLALARAPARLLALPGALLPGLVRRAPGPLRLETFDARFKPLRYSTARHADRLRPAGGGDGPESGTGGGGMGATGSGQAQDSTQDSTQDTGHDTARGPSADTARDARKDPVKDRTNDRAGGPGAPP